MNAITMRIFDIVGATMALIVLSPIFLFIALRIKLSSPGPIFFCQQRVGRYGKLFTLHKFRTMVIDAPQLGPSITIGDDKRITQVGKRLRKYKFDELPQLFDVLIGNMALVGPRPEIPEYVNTYPEEIKQIVLSVRPGITDEASLRLINESSILAECDNPEQFYRDVILPKKLALAVKYVKTRTLMKDCGIILATIIKLSKR